MAALKLSSAGFLFFFATGVSYGVRRSYSSEVHAVLSLLLDPLLLGVDVSWAEPVDR